jgi:hypothetical protein
MRQERETVEAASCASGAGEQDASRRTTKAINPLHIELCDTVVVSITA